MITRRLKYQSTPKKVRLIFNRIPQAYKRYQKLSNLDILIYNADAALQAAIDAAKEGITMYRGL